MPVRSPVRSPIRSPIWTPAASRYGDAVSRLFANGEQGLLLDATVLSSLFQDSAGTTPVSAAGQSIGLVRDQSGRGNNAAQATAGKRPLYQLDGTGKAHIAFDGTDDGLTVASLNMTATDEVTVIAAMRKNSDAARAMLVELSVAATSTTDGCFSIEAPYLAGANYKGVSRGTLASSPAASGFTAPHAAVLTLQGKISTDTAILRVNGVQVASVATDQGTGNFNVQPLFIGMRAGTSLPFAGRLSRLLIVGRLLTASELSDAEAWATTALPSA